MSGRCGKGLARRHSPRILEAPHELDKWDLDLRFEMDGSSLPEYRKALAKVEGQPPVIIEEKRPGKRFDQPLLELANTLARNRPRLRLLADLLERQPFVLLTHQPFGKDQSFNRVVVTTDHRFDHFRKRRKERCTRAHLVLRDKLAAAGHGVALPVDRPIFRANGARQMGKAFADLVHGASAYGRNAVQFASGETCQKSSN